MMFIFRSIVYLVLVIFYSISSFAASYPKLFFEYGEPLDLICHIDDKHQITDEMRKEVSVRLPEFQKLWDKSGPELMQTTVDILKKSYGREEESVALVICPWHIPMSAPFSIRIREYLKSATIAGSMDFFKKLKPNFYFVSQVYHESLHRYLDKNYPGITEPDHSKLIKKYQKESPGVLIHLHLMALQKAVYLKLNHPDELKKIIELDSEIPNPIYKRAWDIVTFEGYEKFLEELK